MPHDPVRLAEVRAWLGKAAGDLRAGAHQLTAVPPILDDVVFHCQQAAEKTLKGFLAWHDQVFRKTHNLEELGELCLHIDPTLRPLIDRIVPLTEYAWKFRYPGESEQPTLEEADAALAAAREIHQAILDRLPVEVRPTGF